MMNACEQDAFAPPPGILERATPGSLVAAVPRGAAALERTAPPVDDRILTETKPLAQSIRRWRGEMASA